MGKVSKQVLGKINGKVGGVAFRDWRGLDVVQTYAEENKSDTEKQHLQRVLFSEFNKDLRKFLCPMRLGFQHQSQGSTEYAEGVKTNWATLVYNDLYHPEDLKNIQLSKGGLRVPVLNSAAVTSGQVVVTWDYSSINPCGKNNPNDTVVVVIAVVDNAGHVVDQAISSTASRSTATLTMTIPTSWTSDVDNLLIYAFAYNEEDASDTSYIAGEE